VEFQVAENRKMTINMKTEFEQIFYYAAYFLLGFLTAKYIEVRRKAKPVHAIEVVKRKGFWKCTLYKRGFLRWRIVEQFNDEIPYSTKIIKWQDEYNVPDELVSFQ
jgi:hypothetical protein